MPTVEQLRKQAAELDITGRSNMNKTALEKAIAAAEGGSPAPADTPQGDKVSDDPAQQARYERTRRNRAARLAEEKAGEAQAARLEREALASTRTGPQQALDRAAAGEE